MGIGKKRRKSGNAGMRAVQNFLKACFGKPVYRVHNNYQGDPLGGDLMIDLHTNHYTRIFLQVKAKKELAQWIHDAISDDGFGALVDHSDGSIVFLCRVNKDDKIESDGFFLECTLCHQQFCIDDDKEGVHGFIGALPIAFCPQCKNGLMDMSKQIGEDDDNDGVIFDL